VKGGRNAHLVLEYSCRSENPGVVKGELIAEYSIDQYNGLVEDTADFVNNLLV
jgi:hypothetical protein